MSASDGHPPWEALPWTIDAPIFFPHCIIVLVLAANELPVEMRGTTASPSHTPCSPKPPRFSPRLKDKRRCGNTEGCERAGGERIPSPAFQNSSIYSEVDGEGDR